MDNLKEHVDQEQVPIATVNFQQKPVQVQLSELERTVKSHNDMAKIYQSLHELSRQEKCEWANFKRLRGDQFYKERNYDQAIQAYFNALVGLDFKDNIQKQDSDKETERQAYQAKPAENTQQNQKTAQQKIIIKEELIFPIILNMVACFYKKREYSKALASCDKILIEEEKIFASQPIQSNKKENAFAAYKKIQSKFAECLFKKAYILIETGNFNQAKKIAQKLSIWEGQQRQKHRENSKQILKIIQNKKRQQTDIYKKIFERNQKSEQQTPLIGDIDGTIRNPQKEQILYPREGFFEVMVDWFLDCSKGIIGRGKQSKDKYSQ